MGQGQTHGSALENKQAPPTGRPFERKLNVIERDISIPAGSFQPHGNRVIRGATLFAQGARLLHEESFDPLFAPQHSVDPKEGGRR
jgi:hypothetical protein